MQVAYNSCCVAVDEKFKSKSAFYLKESEKLLTELIKKLSKK